MLAVSVTLLLLSLPLTLSEDACVWEFQWSEMKTPNNNNITCPPTNINCSLYFNDNMIIYNADSVNHTIYRVDSSEAYMNCDVTSLYRDDDGKTLPPVNVPTGAFTMFNVNRDRLDLTALSLSYLISEVIDGACFGMSFSVGGVSQRNCSDTEACTSGFPCVTYTVPPTTTPTTTPTTPTIPTSTLTGGQTGLLVACCILFVFVSVAVVVLIVVVVYIMWRMCNKGDVLYEGDKRSFELKSVKKRTTRNEAEKRQ